MIELKYDIKRGADIYREIYGSRLGRWISTGKIKQEEILVWRSGLSGWRKAEDLEELEPFFKRWESFQQRRRRLKTPASEILPHKRPIKNILIVDNEKDLCSLLSNALIQRRYNVSIANTKSEAIAYLKKETPDLIFLDLKLPDGDGIRLLSGIKKRSPETAVNIISAYGSEETREEAKRLGAYEFIDKPFTEKQILKSIREIS